MRGEVLTGQLTYVDTEEAQIHIMDRATGEVSELDIVPDIKAHWDRLVGRDVEAVVIDGKTREVYSQVEE